MGIPCYLCTADHDKTSYSSPAVYCTIDKGNPMLFHAQLTMIKHHIAHLQSIVNRQGESHVIYAQLCINNMGYSHLQSIVSNKGNPMLFHAPDHDKTSYSPAVYLQ